MKNLEPVEIQVKETENERLWKKKDGSLVRISSLNNEELIEARKISGNLLDKYYSKKEKALYQVKKCSDICELHGDLLESLDKELNDRKQKFLQEYQILEEAEKNF